MEEDEHYICLVALAGLTLLMDLLQSAGLVHEDGLLEPAADQPGQPRFAPQTYLENGDGESLHGLGSVCAIS